MSYSDLLVQDARLVILRVINEMPNRRANSSVLCSILDEKFGHTLTRVEVKEQLRWLEERELIEIEEAGAVLLATLREKGEQVVRGRVTVEGVKRPRI
ncbi:MAG: ArsR family transcriptional regulator [Zoogloea sp.]|nr:ArsR family transcriptional regulator [Zoogloea sp.]MCE1184189.1 ArsR family transcriptional regulator [Rhodocyclales bacterium]